MDIQAFAEEITSVLVEDDVVELKEKAGVKFPLAELSWDDLCYVACWIGLKKELPTSVHNRMVLGERNFWVELYLKTKSRPVSGLFELAG